MKMQIAVSYIIHLRSYVYTNPDILFVYFLTKF